VFKYSAISLYTIYESMNIKIYFIHLWTTIFLINIEEKTYYFSSVRVSYTIHSSGVCEHFPIQNYLCM
jgi:hypothetical protein